LNGSRGSAPSQAVSGAARSCVSSRLSATQLIRVPSARYAVLRRASAQFHTNLAAPASCARWRAWTRFGYTRMRYARSMVGTVSLMASFNREPVARRETTTRYPPDVRLARAQRLGWLARDRRSARSAVTHGQRGLRHP